MDEPPKLPAFKELSGTQQTFVVNNVDLLWREFVESDPDVLGATCSCCLGRSAFVSNVLALADKAAALH